MCRNKKCRYLFTYVKWKVCSQQETMRRVVYLLVNEVKHNWNFFFHSSEVFRCYIKLKHWPMQHRQTSNTAPLSSGALQHMFICFLSVPALLPAVIPALASLHLSYCLQAGMWEWTVTLACVGLQPFGKLVVMVPCMCFHRQLVCLQKVSIYAFSCSWQCADEVLKEQQPWCDHGDSS